VSFAWAKKKIVGFADTSKQAERSRATSAKADSPDTRGKKPALPHVRPRHSLTSMCRTVTRGVVQWATVAFRASRGDDGTPQRHVLTDRKSEWLDEDSFRDIWEFLPLGMLILDDHGDILKANRRTEHLFGYRHRDLVGTPVSRLVPELAENGWSAYRDKFMPASQTVSPVSAQGLIARRKDGSEFPVDVSFRSPPIKKRAGVLAFVEDKTDHYELLRNRRDLVHLTRVSTMGELAGSLAHELNQPLTAILSNVQAAQRFMAADRIDVAEVREILNDIVQDDYRASEIIRRIRAVVKKGDIEFTHFDLASVIRDVVVLLHSDAIMRETRVALDISDDLPAAYADRVQLQQVVLNLLLNAFDAMSEVTACERLVSIVLAEEGEGVLRIAVRDCGHGLTVDQHETIFKPFYTSKPHGLGLGLSISRSIVERHGGRLWAENNIDRGATFYVTLPTGDTAVQELSR
jgi:two-component system sensor kinase FixL